MGRAKLIEFIQLPFPVWLVAVVRCAILCKVFQFLSPAVNLVLDFSGKLYTVETEAYQDFIIFHGPR